MPSAISRKGCRIEVRANAGIRRPGLRLRTWCSTDRATTAPIESAFISAFRARRKLGLAPRVPDAGRRGRQSSLLGSPGLPLMSLFGHALEGDVAYRRPIMDDEWGFRPGPTNVNVVDDPHLGRGAWLVDDEGTSPRGQRASSIGDDAQDSCWIDQARSLSARSQRGMVGGHRTSTDPASNGMHVYRGGGGRSG